MFAECCDYLGSIIESAWDIFKNATFNYGDVTISFHGVFVDIQSKFVASKLLSRLGLESYGEKKGRYYVIPEDIYYKF